MVSSTPRPHFTLGKDPVSILQEAGWAPGPVWTGGKSRPHRDSIPDRPARSSVAIPTELPGPHLQSCKSFNFGECWLPFRSDYPAFLFRGECACYSYGRKTWCFIMREMHSLKLFEIRVLTKIFGTEEEIIEGR